MTAPGGIPEPGPDPAAGPSGAPPAGPLLCIVGPTATGKSDLAVAVAEAVGGEVVNADASQLYRGMDIGTAKLPAPLRRGVPHHLLDVLEVTEDASVAAYQRAARSTVAAIAARGRLPILVGGSGLYVSAVLDPLVFPGTDPVVRTRLEADLAAEGPGALHTRLGRVDPAAAAVILPGNGRRIVRALEVVELTGGPFAASLPSADRRQPGVSVLRTQDSPAALDGRITARVEEMFARGLVGEVRGLVERGLRAGRTASRALGYAQVLLLLDGVLDEAGARADTVRATRRFARRQRSWFAREAGATPCPVGPGMAGVAVLAARACLQQAVPA